MRMSVPGSPRRRLRLVLTTCMIGGLAAACGAPHGVATAPSPAPSSAASAADGLPAPCAVSTAGLQGLVDHDLGAGRETDASTPGCEWVSAGGEGVVVGRSTVSDWLRSSPRVFDDLRSSGAYDDDALAVLGEAERRLGAGGDLGRAESCEVYRLTLRSSRDPEIDGLTVRVDVDAGTRAMVDVRNPEKQILHVMTCDESVVTSLQVIRSGLVGSDAEVERALGVAADLYS